MTEWKWSAQPTYEGLRRLIEILGVGVIVEDEQGRIVYVNHRMLEWTGYEVEELEFQPVEILVPEELREKVDRERERVHEGDQRTRLSAVRCKNGRTHPAAVAPQSVPRLDNGEPMVLSVLIDLGEVQTARPMGAAEGSLAAELAQVASRLQAMSFSAAVSSEQVAPVDHPVLADLSNREREILEHLMTGSRVPAIAEQLFISPNTVRNHLKAIYRKVDVSSQSELIELVRGLGKSDEVA